MDYYLDIKLLPDPDFIPSMLMNALFSKLHRVLVERRELNVAVSFPEYSLNPLGLGNCLRLYGKQGDLDSLQDTGWLTGMRDHVVYRDVQPVPSNTEYVEVRRVQARSNVERLVRRSAKRKGISEEQAREAYQNAQPKMLRLPFISLNSQSSGRRFSLFIEQGRPQKESKAGEFNRYGISQTATVPWF
ncbi:type I-F CRISPR-associated endoribonuclease Cas6/Csy4 [Parahaliea sp. F7430]|uniref:Type I-F CRISPR-associated endoribonuclease Cas6/Csy4 n=1 Tax=Sediminihaliea albiluteola TaxID=2758564 RepID=A0A7W2TUE3_9GAMM|nr:type I-F CRISPR-associated endoribonuclease Cas6/Csy4 [Sediminihaliea albiluteola]MBA6412060.1 type I-F CRISPR-associated endoribonuclease Cas6/Csy4 [Sediminihaliea albiluteola]